MKFKVGDVVILIEDRNRPYTNIGYGTISRRCIGHIFHIAGYKADWDFKITNEVTTIFVMKDQIKLFPLANHPLWKALTEVK